MGCQNSIFSRGIVSETQHSEKKHLLIVTRSPYILGLSSFSLALQVTRLSSGCRSIA